MANFREFVDRKQRDSTKQLRIIKRVLEKYGFSVDNFLEENDPYIFVNSPSSNLSFDGIRIYKIGNIFAYRVQKERDTHPYGNAYKLDLEGAFNDLVSEKGDEEKAGKETMKALAGELKSFFEKSLKAEKEIRSGELLDNGESGVMVKPGNIDYATQTMNSRS